MNVHVKLIFILIFFLREDLFWHRRKGQLKNVTIYVPVLLLTKNISQWACKKFDIGCKLKYLHVKVIRVYKFV